MPECIQCLKQLVDRLESPSALALASHIEHANDAFWELLGLEKYIKKQEQTALLASVNLAGLLFEANRTQTPKRMERVTKLPNGFGKHGVC